MPTAQAGVTRGTLVPALIYWCGRCGQDRVYRSSLGLRDKPELQALSFHPRLLTWRASGGFSEPVSSLEGGAAAAPAPRAVEQEMLRQSVCGPRPAWEASATTDSFGHQWRLGRHPGQGPRPGLRGSQEASVIPVEGRPPGAQLEGPSQHPRRPRPCQQTHIKTHLSDFSPVSWTESSCRYNHAALNAAAPKPPAGRLRDRRISLSCRQRGSGSVCHSHLGTEQGPAQVVLTRWSQCWPRERGSGDGHARAHGGGEGDQDHSSGMGTLAHAAAPLPILRGCAQSPHLAAAALQPRLMAQGPHLSQGLVLPGSQVCVWWVTQG
ncbi:chemokine-like protein TAFA-5 isoform X1 [Orcinus orca]|uniref:chemokine-like protein TAFA-5 isoform X1 n=1 Tax=Orcinus orca TaxID=9733 RepID=UPI001441CC8C|nr:chemokine-like protein TAFA-5 isoform X1 [Orcinus orca]XP_033261191.1 chemokine-like protein TAFA-5 isoform X1 [Orcinus orca]XP_049550595.1 chemokine-like protein TAFA-5 isoform X1 [Orcinus orca]XP_049550596.1 chemokine-like protein TAFA-5 isoform X1 [Orcinus orca]